MSNKTSFSTTLIHARLASGYTQKEIADFVGISRSGYGHLESGYRIPSIEVLLRLCILYKENPVSFLIPLFPPDLYRSQSHYLQYLTELSRRKYKSNSRRSRKRKSNCWSKN